MSNTGKLIEEYLQNVLTIATKAQDGDGLVAIVVFALLFALQEPRRLERLANLVKSWREQEEHFWEEAKTKILSTEILDYNSRYENESSL